MVPKAKYDVEIGVGETFVMDITEESVKDGSISFTGYEVKAQVRPERGSDELLSDIDVTIDDTLISLEIPSMVTKNFKPGTYYYDVMFIHDMIVEYPLGGKFIVRPVAVEL